MLAKALSQSQRAGGARLLAVCLRRCLSTDKTDMTGWIPPNRPLIGDQSPYHHHNIDEKNEEEELRQLQKEIDKLEQGETNEDESLRSDAQSTLAAAAEDVVDEEEELRRLQQEIDQLAVDEEEELKRLKKEIEKIDQEEKKKKEMPIIDEDASVDWLQTRRRMMGEQAGLAANMPGAARHETLFEVEVKHHTLFRKDEIATIMTSLGGTDIKVIFDNPKERRMGGAMGMILVTVSRPSQIRILADTLVRQMRHRKLEEVDVFGAKQGPEGDETSLWMVVDCHNYIVHILEEQMRQALNLEDVWSGKDPLHRVNWKDEDAVDDYVTAYPVPDNFGVSQFDWDHRFRELQKNRWTAPHKPVVDRPRQKKKNRR
eukprot:scaffold3586_cov164-Amphora_coffeaeformis.AAC.8